MKSMFSEALKRMQEYFVIKEEYDENSDDSSYENCDTISINGFALVKAPQQISHKHFLELITLR